MDVADARPRSLPLHQLLDHALARQLSIDRRGRALWPPWPAQQESDDDHDHERHDQVAETAGTSTCPVQRLRQVVDGPEHPPFGRGHRAVAGDEPQTVRITRPARATRRCPLLVVGYRQRRLTGCSVVATSAPSLDLGTSGVGQSPLRRESRVVTERVRSQDRMPPLRTELLLFVGGLAVLVVAGLVAHDGLPRWERSVFHAVNNLPACCIGLCGC